MNQLLLGLKRQGKLEEATYSQLRSTDGSTPPFYGLVKIHKDGLPLHPIVPFCGSPTYKLSRHLADILTPLVGRSDHSVKNSASFCEFLRGVTIPTGYVLVSFDVVSLFTCVPKNLALHTTKKKMDADPYLSQRTSLSVDDLLMLLSFCLDATEFVFDGQFYRPVFGCAMGSSVSPIVANLVMEDVEERILCNRSFDILYWKRYVDDTFVVLPASEVELFFTFINTVEPSIKFPCEKEDDQQRLSFLDVSV